MSASVIAADETASLTDEYVYTPIRTPHNTSNQPRSKYFIHKSDLRTYDSLNVQSSYLTQTGTMTPIKSHIIDVVLHEDVWCSSLCDGSGCKRYDPPRDVSMFTS
jgi:hypothetical protein